MAEICLSCGIDLSGGGIGELLNGGNNWLFARGNIQRQDGESKANKDDNFHLINYYFRGKKGWRDYGRGVKMILLNLKVNDKYKL